MSDFNLLGTDMFGEALSTPGAAVVASKFVVPPFSVLNAREGAWQERKRTWAGLGITGEIGRGENLIEYSKTVSLYGGKDTSIFDPVLCELAYRWFSRAGDQVVDPFAGGSVRGIVASLLGRRYWGCDLREEQIAANREQGAALCRQNAPEWVCGDSLETLRDAPPADLVFSCPPYGDLEEYSDNAADLSRMDWPDFLAAYREIIRLSCELLKPDRFACFVVGDFRDKRGHYRNFPGETIRAFLDCGMELYNEAVLVTAVGSASMRVTRQFDGGRKLCKTHQNVLVFVKGDWRKAVEE